MIRGKLIDRNLIKSITIYFILFLIMVLGVVLYSKYLPKNSFGADNKNIFLKANIEKYINFKISDQDKGTLIQYNIKMGIESKEDEEQYIPLKQSQIKLEFNRIDGKYPYGTKLIPISTEATNGKNKDIKEDYRYNPETGTLIINVSNLDENGEFISTKEIPDAKDEYIVICYYDTYIEEAVERELDIKSIAVGVLSEDDTLINSQEEFKGVVKENIGNIVSIENITQEIYNGNIKSNIINGTDYNTQYNETQKIVVSKKESQDNIYISEDNEFIRVEKGQNGEDVETNLGNNNELVYKSTIINKDDILKILSENGKIEILDDNQNILATIDTNTEADANGNVVVNYLKDIKSIIIKTSKIQNEGILKIENTKEIKNTMDNVIDTKIKTNVGLFEIENKNNEENLSIDNNKNNDREGENQNKEIIEQGLILKSQKKNIIDIKDSTTNVDFNINKTDWTNKEQNEVLFDISLNSNSMKDNMFKNPRIRIELPEEVEKVILGKSFIAYGNGLELKNVTVSEENGKIIINASIEGIQTTYINNSLNLKTNIQIPATIILRKDIDNSNNDVNLLCENSYTLNGITETVNKKNEIQIISYKNEEITQQQPNANMMARLGLTAATTNQNSIEGLSLEVVPVKGDTVLNDGDIVYEGEFIKYNIKVTNTSDKTIENIKVVGTIPEGTIYGELEADYHTSRIMFEEKYHKNLEDELYRYNYDESVKEKVIEINSLLANESREIFYEVKANDLEENEEKETFTKIEISAEDRIVSSYQINNLIKHAEAKVYVSSCIDNAKNDWCYIVKIESLDEVNLNLKLPKEYEFYGIVNSDRESSVSEDNVVTLRLNSGEYIFRGNIDGKKIENQTEDSKLELKAYATIEYNNQKYKSNENRILYEYENVLIEITSDKEGEEIEYKGEINYQIKIKNIGSTNIKDVTTINLTDYLPREIKPIKITYENYEKEILGYDEENKEYILSDEYKKVEKDIDTSSRYVDTTIPDIDLHLNIPEKENLIININAIADIVLEKTKIENRATVTGDYIITKTSNTVSNVLLPLDYSGTTPLNPDNLDNSEKPFDSNNEDDFNENNQEYSISGVAWLDVNQDGQRQSSEELINGITVMLVDADNATNIQDKKTTDSNGIYKFDNLKKGKYIIVFRYDTNKYSLTDYKKEGVNLSINSDAMDEEITISGKKEKVGLTEILSVDGSIKNIDIGLIKNKVCDLKLDKYISKVTVETASGTKEQFYEKSSLAKVEIKSKEIQGAKVLVEYKLVVTNEGEIPTNVNKVIDYIPDGLEFSTELNKNWNFSKTGELTNESLSNTKIEPGNNIELTLILTKTMTDNTTGTYINEAEIGEISNSLKINDIDSTPGNKIQTEDDYSRADLIISVSTGAILYVYIILTFIFILGLVIYLNIKFGFKRVNKIILLITFLCIGILGKVNQTNAAINKNDYYGPVYFTCNKSYPTYFYGKINGKNYEGSCNMDEGNFGGSGERPYYLYYWKESSPQNSSSSSSASITLVKKNSSDNEIKINNISNNYIIGPFKITGDSGNNYSFNIYISGKKSPEAGTVCDSNGNNMSLSTSASSTTTFYLKLQASKVSAGQRIQSIKCTATKKVSTSTKVIKSVTAYYRPGVLDWDGTTKYKGYTWPTWNGVKYQDVEVKMKIEDKNTSEATKSKEIEWEIKYGNLQIEKVDENNTDVKLSGVQFEIKGPSYQNGITLTTGNDGKTEKLTNILAGQYTVKEISNENYGYTLLNSNNITVSAGMNNTITIKNTKQTGNLVIEKRDADVTTKKLEGVTFNIRAGEKTIDGEVNPYSGKYVKVTKAKEGEGFNSTSNTCTGTVHIQNMTFVENENEATKFITDSEGLIKIYNILKGYYDVEEISVGNNSLYEIDDDLISWDFLANNQSSQTGDVIAEGKDKNKKVASIRVFKRDSRNVADNIDIDSLNYKPYDYLVFNNKRKYINLSGYVWVDDYFGKQTQKDDLYNNGEKLLNGITVRLMKTGVSDPIMTTTTSALNRYQEKNNPDGEYLFKKVPLYDENDSIKDINNTILNQYYIEFEYNGVVYQDVVSHIDVDNGSKAAEKVSERTEFNNKFAVVDGKGIDKPTEGTATSTSGSTIDLYYNEESTEEGKGRKMIWDSSRTVVPMWSRTNETGYNINNQFKLSNGDYPSEIKNINLGLYEKEQPDLSIVSDIESAKATVKGYEYIYSKNEKNTNSKYNQDKADHDQNENQKNITDELKHQFDLATSFGLKYGPEEYTGQLYPSDIGYSEDTQKDDKLKMYVTYRIRLLNTATNLYSRVNEMVSYFDNRYESIESISESDGTIYTKDIDYRIDGAYNKDGYKKVIITKRQDINKESEKYLNITFKLSDEAIKSVLQNDIMLNEVTEITSYTTYSDRYNTLYAGIDKDSNPGNANPADKNTYEDDTDYSPSFKITIREREITGIVWEDSIISNDSNGVKGNGEYDENENVVQNAKVELLEIIENNEGQVSYEPAKLYKYDEGSNTVYDEVSVLNTSQKGEYEFSGILPGKYVIKYTYGNMGEEKTTICDLNGNIIEFNPDDYKSTIYRGGKTTDDGLDWYAKETSVNNSKRLSDARDSDEVIEHRIKDDTEIFYKVAIEKTNELKSIDSFTNNFEVGIEYDGEENKKSEENKRLIRIYFDQVDFGIIKRAEQNLKISKTITWVELVLANGQTIMSGNPQEGEIKYLKILPDGNISIELDSELVQGANLTVKYEVKADTKGTEIDFLDKNYYIYGIIPEDRDAAIRKVNVTKLYDYPVNDFVYDKNNELNKDWQIEEIKEEQKGKYFSEDAYKKLSEYNTVLFTDKFDKIKPNEEKTVTLQLSKVLANNDDISLDNGVEVNILKGSKLKSIPGNYIPGKVYKEEEKESDSDNAYLSVTAPTGSTDNTKEIVIMSISLLVILGTGVIFIKKKILK